MDTDSLISAGTIAAKILVVRGKRVMIDNDLAMLYGVKTGRLNEQVSRNIKRFPEDFMFQLTKEEALNLKSHFAISSWGGLSRRRIRRKKLSASDLNRRPDIPSKSHPGQRPRLILF